MKASKFTKFDFLDDLSSPFARKRFVFGICLLVLFSVGAIYVARTLLPENAFRDVTEAVGIEVLAGLIIVLGFFILYIVLIGPNAGLAEVSVTRPRDIHERMKGLPKNTTQYIFWGRSGGYFRSVALPFLNDQSCKEKKYTNIEIIMPDPDEPKLSTCYQDIRMSLSEEADENTLVSNVIATTIACAIAGANNKYLRIRIFLSKYIPIFRVDISDNGAIVTQDDLSKSALFFKDQSEFYEMLRTASYNEIDLSREINWDRSIFRGLKFEGDSCNEQMLSAFNIKLDDPGRILEQVKALISNSSHRYK